MLILFSPFSSADHTTECNSAEVRYSTSELVRQVIPSTVFIHSVHTEKTPFDNLLKGKPKDASGTGFFIDKNLIITNRHVIDNYGDHYIVPYGIPKRYKVTIIGSDVKSDIAILKVDELDEQLSDIIPLHFAKLNPCQGDNVIAIGHPSGLTWSVSRGIVSHTKRYHNPQTRTLQIDAAVNPGNSGGPLIDYSGEVIGINSLMLSRTASNTGLNLSISAEVVVSVVSQLLTKGQVYRPTLGIEFKEDFDFRGLEIVSVIEGGLLDGVVAEGDIITHVNGHRLYIAADLYDIMLHLQPGSELKVTIGSNTKVVTLPDLLL